VTKLTAADFGGRSFTDLNFDEELQLHKNLASLVPRPSVRKEEGLGTRLELGMITNATFSTIYIASVPSILNGKILTGNSF